VIITPMNCSATYSMLLAALEGRQPCTPADYVRAWASTEDCAVDVSFARGEVTKRIYSRALANILASRERHTDPHDAWAAMNYSAYECSAALLSAISWPEYLATRPHAWWLRWRHNDRFPGTCMARKTLSAKI